MKTIFSIFLASAVLLLAGCTPKDPAAEIGKVYQGSPETINVTKNEVMESFNQTALPEKGDQIVVIGTTMGEIKIKLFPEFAPKTVENFVGLAEKGYYDGIIFHRVIPDFMIQGGDPTGTGRGGESLWGGKFADEFNPNLTHLVGAVSMANAGPNTNGSQFFIVQNPAGTDWLDGRHTIFGHVYEGMDIVNRIANAERDAGDKPVADIKMTKVSVETY